MGLAPIMAIYQARFNKYLQDRGIKNTAGTHVWAFLGDGETDEPETLGAITLAGREELDNLIFVINCNLQRLDGPVRGNGKIIQELEGIFRGAGWNVIKVIWGDTWDPLLAKDKHGLLVKRMGEVVDGEFQKYTVMPGAYIREHFFGKYPELVQMVRGLSDEELKKLRRGGHDPEKVYAALQSGRRIPRARPTVVLAKTIKGYGLGEVGEGKQRRPQPEEAGREGAPRVPHPLRHSHLRRGSGESAVLQARAEDSEEIKYLKQRRKALGGFVPTRNHQAGARPKCRGWTSTRSLPQGSGEREGSTTSALRCAVDQAAQGQADRQIHRADRAGRSRAPSAWKGCSSNAAFTRTPASFTSRSMPACWPITARPPTARCWKKASPRRARWPRSSPPAPPIPRTEST